LNNAVYGKTTENVAKRKKNIVWVKHYKSRQDIRDRSCSDWINANKNYVW